MLLKSINYWSMPGGLEGTLDPVDFLRTAKDHGYQAAELAIGDASSALGVDASESKCRKIVEEAQRIGIQLPSVASGLYWDRNLGDRDPAKRAKAQSDLREMLQISSWLGARTLLVIPGAVEVFFKPDRPVQPYKEVWSYATEGLRPLVAVAQSCGVRMGIENVWNKFLLSPQEMAGFIDQFGSPYLGAYVDVGNVLAYGHAEDWLRHLGRRVVGVHFKDFRKSVGNIEGFVDLLEGDVNWPEVMKALAEISFAGPVVAELIPQYKHHALVRSRNASTAMDAILGR